MIAGVAGFVAYENAADHVPLPGGLVPATDLRLGQAHHFCEESSLGAAGSALPLHRDLVVVQEGHRAHPEPGGRAGPWLKDRSGWHQPGPRPEWAG